MTYTLEIPIEAAHMAEAEKKAWRLLGGLPPGTPYRIRLEEPPQPQPTAPAPSILPFPAPAEGGQEKAQGPRTTDDQPQSPRAWTRDELSFIEDGIVPAWKRYDAEFVTEVEKKAGGL